MIDYEYIIQQVKKFHFTKWDANVLRECQSLLPNLTREELFGAKGQVDEITEYNH